MIKATAYYVWTFWWRGIFPFVWTMCILMVLAGAYFLSHLALLEQARIVLAWCMSIWHIGGMLNFLACYHAYMRYCRMRSVDAWYVSLQNKPMLQHVLVWGSICLIHFGMYVVCLMAGVYLEWLISGDASWRLWGHWLMARFWELLLMGGLLQWAYAPRRDSCNVHDAWHDVWKASLSVSLLIVTAYASPWLRGLMTYARQRELDQASGINIIMACIEWFLRTLPPFYLAEMPANLDGRWFSYSYLYMLGYLLLLLGCGLWSVRLSGRA